MLDRAAVLVVGLVAGFAVGFGSRPGAVGQTAPATMVAAATPVLPRAPSASHDGQRDGRVDTRAVSRVARSGTVRIGVFGDSFGVGVWDAMYRLFPKNQGYEVLRFSKEATGFTRYRVDDLEQHAREQLAAHPVDVAVVSVGVNDAQDMWEGKLYTFMSPEWKQVVGERIDRFVKTVHSTGARVWWIGLPAMREPALDAKVQALNAFFAARVTRLGVVFVDTRPLSVDGRGRYASHLPVDRSEVPQLMRTGDGVHMIGIGYQRIVSPAVRGIRVYADQVRVAARRSGGGGAGS